MTMSAQVSVSCSACPKQARRPLASTVKEGSAPGRSPEMARRQVFSRLQIENKRKSAQTLTVYTRVILLPSERCLQVLSAGTVALCCCGRPSSVYAFFQSPSQRDSTTDSPSTSGVPATQHTNNQYDNYAGDLILLCFRGRLQLTDCAHGFIALPHVWCT